MSYDEKALRRPDFQADSVAIELADGQEWYFPKPYIEGLFPKVVNGRVVGMASSTHFGPDFDALMQPVTAAPDGFITYQTFLPMAVFLLNFNYNLPDEAYAVLLRFMPDHPESSARFQNILDVATGAGPKPSAAGGASPPST